MSTSDTTRISSLIGRIGRLGASLLGSTAVMLAALIIVYASHSFAGETMRAVDWFNAVIVPYLLGVPAFFYVATQIVHLETAGMELLRLSRYDGTTGAYNRRYLIECAESMCQHARMTGESVSLILIDADQFKMLNDRFGHPAGDAVLRRLVRIMHALKQPAEVYGRYGGEEFAIFLANATLDEAGARADEIRRAFAVGEVVFRGETIKSTISMGVACCSGTEATVARIVARADSALYAAKRAGRNRTELAVAT